MKMNPDTIHRAVYEIRQLRRENELLAAQVHVINTFAAALGLRQSSGAMSPDISYRLEQELAADAPKSK